MKIRLADMHDAENIAKVTVLSWRSTYKGIIAEDVLNQMSVESKTMRWKRKIRDKSEIIVVAEINNTIVGYASGGRARSYQEVFEAELYAIYCLEEAQQQGTGKRLMQKLLQILINDGMTSMMVWVLENNKAKGFYKYFGAEWFAYEVIKLGGDSYRLEGLGWKNIRNLYNEMSRSR